jgi:peptidyl-prolyl cis-trans isomerase B (cyclophilin B)
MARGNAPDSGSSQFFIVHKTSENNTKALDGNYAAFGMVTDGMEIIDKMIADTVAKGYTESVSKADQPIIESIEIHAAH